MKAMQEVSELYRELWESMLYRVETKAVIGGTEYTKAEIVSCETVGALLESAQALIGNCISRQIDIAVRPKGDIPQGAEIKLFVRLTDGTRFSEWLPKGVFFAAERDEDYLTGVITLHGYDAMMRTDEVWLDETYDGENWPMPAENAVGGIASRIGVEIDGRTELSTAFPVYYPVDEEGDMTMREALKRIAVANAGNWIMTDAGKLRFVGIGSEGTDTSYLSTETGDAITLGGIRLIV